MKELNQATLNHMLLYAAQEIESKASVLNELDSHTGDGDHGTTMLRVCQCIESSLQSTNEDWKKKYDDLGWLIMSQDGGSAGMLVGNFYSGIADGLTKPNLTSHEVAKAFRSGLERVEHFSGAHRGDKTMLDAMLPAVDAMELAAKNEEEITTVFAKAAKAAQQGAQATKNMRAARGRAKNMGDKSIGYLDPGAISMALLFSSLAGYLEKNNSMEESYHG